MTRTLHRIVIGIVLGATSAAGISAQERWADPSVFNVGRAPARATFVPYPDRAAALETALGNAPHGAEAHMRHCADQLMLRMGELREAADALEVLVDDTAWPLPTYQEMLFVR